MSRPLLCWLKSTLKCWGLVLLYQSATSAADSNLSLHDLTGIGQGALLAEVFAIATPQARLER